MVVMKQQLSVYLPVEMWHLISCYLTPQYLWYPFRAIAATPHALVTQQMDNQWKALYESEYGTMVHKNVQHLPKSFNKHAPWCHLFVERTRLLNRFWSVAQEPLLLLQRSNAATNALPATTTTTTSHGNVLTQWIRKSINKAKTAWANMDRDKLLLSLKRLNKKKNKTELERIPALAFQLLNKHCDSMHYHLDALQSLVKYYSAMSKYALVVVYATMWIECLLRHYDPHCTQHVHPLSRNLLGYAHFARGHGMKSCYNSYYLALFKTSQLEQARQDLTTSIESYDYIKSHAFFCRMIVNAKLDQCKAAYKDYHSISNKSKYAHKIPYFKMAEYLYGKKKYKDCKQMYKQTSKQTILKWKRLFSCAFKQDKHEQAFDLYQQAYDWYNEKHNKNKEQKKSRTDNDMLLTTAAPQEQYEQLQLTPLSSYHDVHQHYILPRMDALQATQSCSSSSPREHTKHVQHQMQVYYLIKLQFATWETKKSSSNEGSAESARMSSNFTKQSRYWQKINAAVTTAT